MLKEKILYIDKVAERIKLAIKNGERIILYGDSDMDGISSVVLLQETIEHLGGKVDATCFPNRESDGYGITASALEYLKEKVPALLITLDLGIGNVKEAVDATALGFEVIIVDHHQPLAEIPQASLVVDYHQPGDNYPFKNLANVGVTYNLAYELLDGNIPAELNGRLLELAALGTIADMMPQVEQNREMIDLGLASLKHTTRPAFQAFHQLLKGSRKYEETIAPGIISAINASESAGFKSPGYELITAPTISAAKDMAQDLMDKAHYKQEQIKSIVEEIERRIAKKGEQPIIFEGDPAWKLILAGSAASILVKKYEKPIFIFRTMDGESAGSVRNPKGTDGVAAMRSCADILVRYGGHVLASGFRVKNEHLDAFRNRLIEYFANAKAA